MLLKTAAVSPALPLLMRRCAAPSLSLVSPAELLATPELLSALPAHLVAAAAPAAEILTIPDPSAPEGGLFGFSLFPYLAFLYFIGWKGNQTPSLANFGFQFLLAFVFGSIPAAIIASVCFNVTLADCDWAHGTAEGLLTITNLFIVIGFRQGPQPIEDMPAAAPPPQTRLAASAVPLIALLLLSAAGPPLEGDFFGLGVHSRFLGGFGDLPASFVQSFTSNPEPLNALSIPTWLIHVSSLVEWLVAMGLVWRFAKLTGNERWKGVTWGMLPLHSSGICAVTYHIFYNAPPLAFLVALQALLTCIGNTTVAFAAWRLAVSNGWDWRRDGAADLATLPLLGPRLAALIPEGEDAPREREALGTPEGAHGRGGSGAAPQGEGEGELLAGFEDLGDAWSANSDVFFAAKLLIGCTAASYAIKYGEVVLPPDLEAPQLAALALIFGPSLLNALKWARRGAAEEEAKTLSA